MESVFSAPTEQIRIARAMAPFRAAWQRHAYAEAALAGTIPGPVVTFVETQLVRLQDHVDGVIPGFAWYHNAIP